MKLSRARPACKARVRILPCALAVLGLAHLHSVVAKTQITDTSGQSYYENARPLLDYSLPDLLRAAPELQGLEPAGNQDKLGFILDKAGDVTEDLLGRMPNLISREEVTQVKPEKATEDLSGSIPRHLVGGEDVTLAQPRNQIGAKHQRRHEFDYLILVHRQDANVTVEEYRPGAEGTGQEAQDLEEGYTLTRGFATVWLHFHPSNQSAARFRYLGQQTEGGVRCYVVAFAQKPGWATVIGIVNYKGISVRILYQGIAWIDQASFRIVRMRTDMLAPRPDIGLQRQTTDLHFGETRLPELVTPLWLPQEVVVTSGSDKQLYQNVHRYSDYRLFKVESKILSSPPDQPLPTKPN